MQECSFLQEQQQKPVENHQLLIFLIATMQGLVMQDAKIKFCQGRHLVVAGILQGQKAPFANITGLKPKDRTIRDENNKHW